MAAYAPLAGIPNATQGQEQLNQNALAEYTRAAQEKEQTALLAQQTQAAQQQNQATQAVNQAYQGAFKKDANGNMSLDTDGLQQALAANGHGAAIPAVIKGITDYQTSKAQLQEQQQKLQTGTQDALGNLGYALQQAKYDPQLAHTIIQDHLNDPGLDPQHRQQLLAEQQQITQNPALIKSLADQWVAQSPAQQAKEIERQKAVADTTKATAETTNAATNQTKAQTEQQEFQAKLPGGPLETPDKAELHSYLTAPSVPGESLPVDERTPASFVSWKAKQSPMAMVMGNMLGGGGQGSALDQAAERYSKDGTLPSGFARSPGTTAAIIQRSAQLHPEQDLAANKATFAADTGSLKQVQKQFDAMNAFEGTALKNLDLYAQTAAKIPDLGAKFANVPLRMITGGMIGTDNMAALNAARQTASSEVAKVLSSATGSGVLSDTQKKEAQDVVDGNLSFSATMKVVQTLKQDMANRHESYQQDINAIRGRLGAKAQTQDQGGANTTGAFNWNNFSEHK